MQARAQLVRSVYVHAWFSLLKKTFRDLSGFAIQKQRASHKVSRNLQKNRARRRSGLDHPMVGLKYLSFNDLCTASRIPFTKAPASSDENFLAKSNASLRITFGGVSVVRSS